MAFHQRKVLDMIFDEPHRMRGTRLIRPIEPIQSFCSSASCFKGLFTRWLVFPVHGPVYIGETNRSSVRDLPHSPYIPQVYQSSID
jgi:hypothetical protein